VIFVVLKFFLPFRPAKNEQRICVSLKHTFSKASTRGRILVSAYSRQQLSRTHPFFTLAKKGANLTLDRKEAKYFFLFPLKWLGETG